MNILKSIKSIFNKWEKQIQNSHNNEVMNNRKSGTSYGLCAIQQYMNELEKADPLNKKSISIINRKIMYFVTFASDGGYLLQKMRIYKNKEVGNKITVSKGYDLKEKMFNDMKMFKEI